MNNVNDFLAKLNNVVWTEDTRRDKEIRGVLLGKEVQVTLHIKIDSVLEPPTALLNKSDLKRDEVKAFFDML